MKVTTRVSRIVVISLLIALGAALTGGGATGARSLGKVTFGKVVFTAKRGQAYAPWMKWNASSCSYVTVSNHPAAYQSITRKATKPLTLAYAPEDFVVPFVISNTKNIQKIAQLAGIKVKVYNNNYPSQTDPLTAADNIVTTHPDVVLEANVIDTLYPTILKKLKDACLPVVTMYLSEKGYPMMGASWTGAGAAAGNYMAKQIKQRKWNPADVAIYECRSKVVGTTPATAFPAMEAALKKMVSGIGKIYNQDCGQTADNFQTTTTAWLSSHPNIKYLISYTINDEDTLAMDNAFEKAGRKLMKDTLSVANGADNVGIQQIRKGREASSVAFFPEKYGEYLLPLAEDVLAGNPVPSKSGPPPLAITLSNIGKYYPK